MAKIAINKMDVYYEEQGSGDEVLIFAQHNGRSENEMLSLLSPEYHIYIVDLPGYGRSTNLKKFRGFTQWSDDIYTFSRKLSINKFIYTGFSMTGIVGYQLAYDHPEAVKALIAIVSVPISKVPSPPPDEQKTLDSGNVAEHEAIAQKRFLFPAPTTDKARIRRRKEYQKQVEQKSEASDPEDLSVLQENILRTKEGREKFVPRLKDLKVPTLILFGSQDYSNPIGQAIVSAMSIPGVKAVFFQDYGHGLSIEGPEQVADEIKIFVNDLNRK
jgi:3-oxoadipate enol-lactonase